MEKKKIVAGYCRVSTLEQKKKGYGIEIQRREIESYCRSNGLVVDDFYIDEARSGATENRKALRRLVKDCNAGKVNGIIISSLDRLSRNLRLTENLLWDFDRLGVTIFIADMPYYDGNNRKDVLIRQIRAAIAEENRKEIIERLKKGREERIRKGRMAGGTIPYGYQRIGKEIIKKPGETGIIRLIFFLRDQLDSTRKIADYLNDLDHRRRNGTPWTQRQVWAILNREELYKKGIVRYGESQGKNPEFIVI
ncbi:MAG: Transposon gamma-delta resolvase [Syntrophorhabdaceae bacterium PtaU1.Bin034]|jgi:site-specific DNA recombinase|nr:MAG: Transposon gamma-delta resolvase [Syntrophorhabdaceae bacterium PtaU1.Bin034]